MVFLILGTFHCVLIASLDLNYFNLNYYDLRCQKKNRTTLRCWKISRTPSLRCGQNLGGPLRREKVCDLEQVYNYKMTLPCRTIFTSPLDAEKSLTLPLRDVFLIKLCCNLLKLKIFVLIIIILLKIIINFF